MVENFFHFWFVIGFIHTLYICIKIFPHIKEDQPWQYWIGLWVYRPSILDDKGLKYRTIFLISMPIYFLVGLALASS